VSRYLLCPMTEGVGLGPVSQLLTVAEALALRGHECAFVANASQADLLARCGFPSFVAPVPDRHDPTAVDFRMCDTARQLGISDAAYFDKALTVEQTAVDEFRPHAMLSAMKLTAPLTARNRGIPLMSIASCEATSGFTSPLYPDVTDDTLPDELRNILILNGFEDVQDIAELCYERSDQWIAPFSREFDPFLPTTQLHYVGPLLSAGLDLYTSSPSLPTDGGDLVVAYLNRGSQPVEHFLGIIAAAARQLRSHHFVVVGQPEYAGRCLASNVTITGHAPILRLLQRSAVFISGGGCNAIMAALLTGTPIVGLPGMVAERDFNVRRAVELGAATLVGGYPAAAERTVDVIQHAVRDSTLADGAHAAGRQLRLLPGPGGVVDILEAL
jgi:UDP:flavonoid glycosyltransferase YjiC (YdhE family)